MVSQTLIEELKQQKIWLIYFKTITKTGNTTKSPRSAKNTATEKDIALNTKHFLDLVRRYTDIQELDAEIIREFVEKIIVYKAERVDGQKLQKIKIIWNCIGEFQTPTSHQ